MNWRIIWIICYVSECDNKIVGAVWGRIMDDYGHIDDETPSFAISLLIKDYRNYGIGTELMKMDVMVNIQYVHFLPVSNKNPF